MKNFFKNSYRVVRDSAAGYEAQYRPWWLPFWIEIYGTNTSNYIDRAEELCHRHAANRNAVKYLGKLP